MLSLSRVNTSALMAENVHLKEMLVTQLDLIQQQVLQTYYLNVFPDVVFSVRNYTFQRQTT